MPRIALLVSLMTLMNASLLNANNLTKLYQTDILDFNYWMNDSYLTVNMTGMHRLQVYGNMLNAFDGQFQVHSDIPCETKIDGFFAVYLQNKYEQILNKSATLYEVLHGFSKTPIGKALDYLRVCLSPFPDCPIPPGIYTAKDCYIAESVGTSVIGKRGNLTYIASTPQEAIVGELWIIAELDDSARNRARKPSASQRNRRKNFSQSTRE